MLRLAVFATTAALSATAAGSLGAQQPDTLPARDSVRRDSIARHDSLLFDRARRRIEGEAESQAPPREINAPIRQGLRAPRLRVSVGATAATAFAEDVDGVEVGMATAPLVGLGVAWDAMMNTTFTFGARAARAASTFEEDGQRWTGDPILLIDAVAGVERELGSRFALRAGAVGAWVQGPRDVVPFTGAGANNFHLGAEFGGSLRLLDRLPLALALTAQPVRLGGSSVVEPGTVTRFLLELRYGR